MKITVKQAGIIVAIILAVVLGVIYFVKFETVLTSMVTFLFALLTGTACWIARGLYEKYRRRWENISR